MLFCSTWSLSWPFNGWCCCKVFSHAFLRKTQRCFDKFSGKCGSSSSFKYCLMPRNSPQLYFFPRSVVHNTNSIHIFYEPETSLTALIGYICTKQHERQATQFQRSHQRNCTALLGSEMYIDAVQHPKLRHPTLGGVLLTFSDGKFRPPTLGFAIGC